MNTTYSRPHRGDLVLNLSILSLYFFPLGIVAWLLGSRDLARMSAGLVDPAGRGTIQCSRFVCVAAASINVLVIAALAGATALVMLGVSLLT